MAISAGSGSDSGSGSGGGDAATAAAWAAVGGADGVTERVGYRGAGVLGGGRLPVRELARATVGVCSLAAAELAAVRAGGCVADVGPVVVDEGAVSTAFVSERHLLVEGRAPVVFAPLSGFWRTADGWVRTHANYPHHREALVRGLGLAADTPEALREALAGRGAVEVEEAVYAAGGLAVAVARAYGDPLPLVEKWDGAARGRRLGPGALPASGVRVLDLTRVIAGPVATRTLGLLGADVLRIDSPRLAEGDDAYADTGFGKRSALLDLGAAADREAFERLLAEADVVVTGYRPGALERYGLSAEELLERRPGLVVAQLCAWGWSGNGPWAGRRGFDSLVQAGYGIAAREAGPDGTPGVLPAQALDHGTGYLMAAGVLRALADGGGRALRYSLAGTGSWLVRGVAAGAAPLAGGRGAVAYDAGVWLREVASGYGVLRHAVSPVGGGPGGGWLRGPSRFGTDAAEWAG
ncbi:CoA transferase [Streptomyces sp. NBC_00536]|uniref:CoA transferase n=1 Tax=Streptomyces sp. NBC_00536 TaxID=2975769 RepID=UPI002E8103EC|nr:CoA transferase [Streptomyces sp. NBC_00536]WUC79504.1 CoA transferase [Streptomyces sp. NBC_00536]